MDLSLHLAELLKTNDCVIIPDLGGFISNYRPSEYDPQVNKFSPPSKEIIFSSKLKKNDGLLVNYICEQEDVKYLEARKIVSEFVTECMFKLENGEKVEFDQLGTLYFDQNEHLLFDAGTNKHTRTDAFGLESFHFPQLVNKYNQPPKPVFRDKAPEPQVRRRPAVKYLLLALPILAVLYFIPKGTNHDPVNQLQTSNAASISLTEIPTAKNPDTNVPNTNPVTETTPAANKVEEKTNNQAVKDEMKQPEPVLTADHAPVTPTAQPGKAIDQTSAVEPSEGKFHVIGGCFKIRENADKLAEKLIKQGYHAQVANLGKNFYRVSVNSYQTKEEAEQTLFKLQEAEPETGYWLMVDKR